MSKLLLVARREYMATVKRKGFLIATFGMPLILGALLGFMAVIGFFTARSVQQSSRVVAIVDQAQILKPEAREEVTRSSGTQGLEEVLEQIPSFLRGVVEQQIDQVAQAPELRLMDSPEAARDDPSVDAYYVIPQDFLQEARVELYSRTSGVFDQDRPAWITLQRWIRASLLFGVLDDNTSRLMWSPLPLQAHSFGPQGQSEEEDSDLFKQVKGFVVPYLFTIIFFMAVMSSSGYLLQGVAEEKENRVIEILLSSVTSNELLAGKVLGQCGAGLTQIAVWLLIAFIPAVSLLPFLEFRPVQFITAPIYFILGFLLFGTLMGAFGSLGNNVKESQQWAMVWSFAAVSPFFAIAILMQQPNGTLAQVLSFIPLTSPLTVVLRTSMTQVPAWEIIVSLLILLLSLFLVVRLSAKLFRVGILLYGKRPSLGEIFRWMRAA
ncbi:MAG TPA: ABC transporter permease [Acidobacteriota bacterium]|nr:ABC transporter permease [Acidobacteriota bacterium]